MQNDNTLILYSTQGCHLCEQALEMLNSVSCPPQIIDIAFDDKLFERYGVTIPVLNYAGSELNWPFTIETLLLWLEEHGITYHT